MPDAHTLLHTHGHTGHSRAALNPSGMLLLTLTSDYKTALITEIHEPCFRGTKVFEQKGPYQRREITCYFY